MRWVVVAIATSTLMLWLGAAPMVAQDRPAIAHSVQLDISEFPLELERLDPNAQSRDQGRDPNDGRGDRVMTSTMISRTGLTPPSLWWVQQQVGGKLLRGWIAYPQNGLIPPYVDLVVNRQLWGLSDYLERYRFVHHVGQAAQDFGYIVRVFNDVGEYLAAYPCRTIEDATSSGDADGHISSARCSIIVDATGIEVLRDSNSFGEF